MHVCMWKCISIYGTSFYRTFFSSVPKYKNHFKENSHVRQTWSPLLCFPFWCLNAYESKHTNVSNFTRKELCKVGLQV